MAEYPLTLRRTVIAGETAPDDYIVMWKRLRIGRILRSPGVPSDRPNWSWGVAFPHRPQLPAHRGLESSLEEAKRRFRVVWSSIERELTEEDIRRAREEEEAIATRPWNRHGGT